MVRMNYFSSCFINRARERTMYIRNRYKVLKINCTFRFKNVTMTIFFRTITHYYIIYLTLYERYCTESCCAYLKFENHLTSCAVLFLLNLMSGKYIFSMAELGYRTQKNISLAFRKCIGVRVDE